MTKDEALRLALEALKKSVKFVSGSHDPVGSELDDINEAITAIKAALEAKDEPEQMAKLGWQVIDCPICGGGARAFPKQEAKDEPDHSDELTIAYMSGLHRGKEVAQRTWVGLTNQDLADCWDTIPERAMRRVEAKLKEKNT
jgi:hypothetical protein